MGSYREEAVILVSRMRDLWPVIETSKNKEAGPLDLLPEAIRQQVDGVRDELVKYIKLLGYPDKASRRPSLGLNKTRRDMDDEDYHGSFWEGVSRGLRTVKPRISPDGEVDTNDPLYYLIFKGKCAILDYQRSTNLKKLMQRCHVCGAQHRLYRPNPNAVPFDTTRAIEIRGFRGEDMEQVKIYRKRLLLEKLKRLPSTNICKECYFKGVRDWYPTLKPNIPGSEEFEADILTIDFMHVCHDTDMIEVYSSGSVSSDHGDFIDIIENTATNYLGDEPAYYDDVEDNFDLISLKRHIFINIPNDKMVFYRIIFDIVYGESEIPCAVCPRRAKARVGRGENIVLIRHQVAKILSKNPEIGINEISLGDWDSKYTHANSCAGKPRSDCDNIAQRIADCFSIQPIKAREIIKRITNRYNAVRTIENLIQETIAEENAKKNQGRQRRTSNSC